MLIFFIYMNSHLVPRLICTLCRLIRIQLLSLKSIICYILTQTKKKKIFTGLNWFDLNFDQSPDLGCALDGWIWKKGRRESLCEGDPHRRLALFDGFTCSRKEKPKRKRRWKSTVWREEKFHMMLIFEIIEFEINTFVIYWHKIKKIFTVQIWIDLI